MRRWIAALLLLLVGGPLLLATACGGGGATTAGPGTPVPPGWDKHASSEGLTLSVDPASAQVGWDVTIRGSVSSALHPSGGQVSVEFWPEGTYRSLGKQGETKYLGEPGLTISEARINSEGSFEADKVPVPRVIKVGDELRLTEPGQHWFALVLDDKHAVFAPFKVLPEQPLPTLSPAPYLSPGSFQFLDSETGWISAESCRNPLRATPDEYGNIPTQPSPICKSGFYGTTDGGQTWSLRSNDGVGPFVMDGSGVGLAAGGFCEYSPCNNSVLRTTDGGRHWSQTYTSTLWLTDLTFIEGEAWLIGDSCGYSDRGSCERYLLKSTDSGSTWSQTTLPITGCGISISRPTAHDAWITTMNCGPGTAEMIVTHDDGKTWNELPHPTGYAFETEIFFRTAQQGWLMIGGQPGAGSQAKELFGTDDGGMSWTHLSGGPTDMSAGYLGPAVFTSAEDGWLATAHVGLSHTTDGGAHWSRLDLDRGQTDPNPVVQFADAEHGWTTSDDYSSFTGARKILWSTSDGGATWQRVPLPAPERP